MQNPAIKLETRSILIKSLSLKLWHLVMLQTKCIICSKNKNESTTILPDYKYMHDFLKKLFGLVKILRTLKPNHPICLESLNQWQWARSTHLVVSTVDVGILLLGYGDRFQRLTFLSFHATPSSSPFSSPLWVVGLRRGEWVAQVPGSCLHQTLDKTPNLFFQILAKPVRNTKFDPIQTTNWGFRVPCIVQFVLGFVLMAQLNWAKDNQRLVYWITLDLAFSVEMCHVPSALKYEGHLDVVMSRL